MVCRFSTYSSIHASNGLRYYCSFEILQAKLKRLSFVGTTDTFPRTVSKTIPRAQWTEHPNLKFLQQSSECNHTNFRPTKVTVCILKIPAGCCDMHYIKVFKCTKKLSCHDVETRTKH